MAVAVISHWFDPTADHVIQELNEREAPLFRFDLADFPRTLSASGTLHGESTGVAWAGHLHDGSRSVRFRDLTGILYRRPTSFSLGEGLPEEEARWATEEARLGFGGLLSSLDVWLNHPHRIAFAEYKPVQMQVAARCGLAVPKTIITNNPAQARAFCESVDEAVYKPLSAGQVVRDGRPLTIYANRVSRADFGAQEVRHTAHLFQEWIEHDYAVRVTVVDENIFATAIHAHSEAAQTDWRTDFDALTYEPVTLPDEFQRGIQALMSGLGLRFGALDFLVRSDGSHVFLEINLNGQWAWIEDTAPAIASAMAGALVKDERRDLS